MKLTLSWQWKTAVFFFKIQLSVIIFFMWSKTNMVEVQLTCEQRKWVLECHWKTENIRWYRGDFTPMDSETGVL